MLSDKYIAGFLDADGSIQMGWRKVDRADSNPEIKKPYICLEFTQKETRDKVLYLIQNVIGGSIDTKNGYSRLRLFGEKARMVLQRISKYLVIKKHYAQTCLQMHAKPFNKKEAVKLLKQERREKSLPLPNFPSRKWLAGYVDGDGCFAASNYRKDTTIASVLFSIVASDYDSEGLEIIHKNFGGSLVAAAGRNKEGLSKYTLYLDPSKAKKFVGYFSQHLIVKKSQADFILGCAEKGHYRDGSRISQILKQLKAHPHRLNEPEVDIHGLLQTVDFTIETRRQKAKRIWEENNGCIDCGRSDVSYYCDSLCRACYDKRRQPKR